MAKYPEWWAFQFNDTIDDAKYFLGIQASNIILLGPLTFINIVHIYTLPKSKYDSYYRLWETALKLEMLHKFVQRLN